MNSSSAVEDAGKCAEQLREGLHDIAIHHAGQTITGITASFGVAVWPTHAKEPDELLKIVDRALYSAKNSGRDRVVIA